MPQKDDHFQDFMNAGADILNSVNRAIDSGDFSNLNANINQAVNRVSKQVYQASSVRRTTTYSHVRPSSQEQIVLQSRYHPSTELRKKNGTGDIVKGVIIDVVCAPIVLSLLIVTLLSFTPFRLVVLLLSAAGFGLGVKEILKGLNKKKLLTSYKQYVQAIGDRTYISIQELASSVNQNSKTVLDQLHKLIDNAYFPKAKIDKQNTTLMLTDDVYRAYLESEEELKRRKQAEEAMTPEERQIQQMLDDGAAYVKSIRSANDAIPDEIMSDKLDRLEAIMTKIFQMVKKHPQTSSDLRKLMDYYLPTIEKLLHAYIDLDSQTVSGPQMNQSKKQIEEVLDTVNDAFENLLDSMYTDMAWDISSDISVMQTMLRQDGLTSDKIN